MLCSLFASAVQVIAATNRPDTLDPALLRSGRLDRKIELPLPTEDARARIMQIHSRKMNIDKEGTNACLFLRAWAVSALCANLLLCACVCACVCIRGAHKGVCPAFMSVSV